MTRYRRKQSSEGFSLVEVVVALGIVSFSVLATVGLLSVANDTNRRSRDETFAAQLAANEFARLRSLSAANFPTGTYNPRYFTADLAEVGANDTKAVYKFGLTIVPMAAPAAAEFVFNADVSYPALAPTANQTVVRFTTLMNRPK
jgi:type II secretory pathway pseudopilin PulG